MGEATGNAAGPSFIRLSDRDAATRASLLARYRAEVYEPAFPDPDLREDTDYWLRLLAEDPGPPQPRLDLILALGADEAILGGVTIEHYRTADCGLLTYIAVAPDGRDRGLGKALVAEARRRLAEWAGKDVPLLAETEIYDEAEDEHERDEVVLRQNRLARLGARLVDFDYVMPPLSAGQKPRRLHLMQFDKPEPGGPLTIGAARVLALMEELAAALGADLVAHPETAAMVAALRGDESLAIVPLPATRFSRRFRENPAFAGIAEASFSFAFELRVAPRDEADAPPRAAYRLEHIEATLEQHAKADAALVEPVRSFLDDVTTGPPGRNGRPLIFAASATPMESPERQIEMRRPPHWHYKAEGKRIELSVDGGEGARVPMRLLDTFCAFEGGRLFYVLTLTLAPGSGAAIDEYSVLQLEAMAIDPRRLLGSAAHLDFAWPGGAGSLLALAEARLDALEAEAAPRPNGVADILRRFDIIRVAERREPLKGGDLKGLCVAIEDDRLVTLAERAEHDTWNRTGAADEGGAGLPLHSDPDNDLAHDLLAFAGMVQGIADFPYQDDSEVHDSTRRTNHSVESALYAHPRFLIEVGTSWRTFQEARPDLGTCPYLLLMWLVAINDELVISEMEAEIDAMVYAPGTEEWRAVPLADIDSVLGQADSAAGRDGAGLIASNLRRRFELFRWRSINRSSNVFRYPKEKQALEAIQASMGTAGRFERAHGLVDRIKALVEDVSALQSTYAERRSSAAERKTNALLAAIAILGAIALPKAVRDAVETWGHSPAMVIAPVAALAAVGLWLVLRARRSG